MGEQVENFILCFIGMASEKTNCIFFLNAQVDGYEFDPEWKYIGGLIKLLWIFIQQGYFMNSEYNYFNMIIKPDTEHHSKMEILFLAVHQMKSTIYFEYCKL